MALAEARVCMDQSLALASETLWTQALTIIEEERKKKLYVLEDKLSSHVTK